MSVLANLQGNSPRRLVQKAETLEGIPRAFRSEPLRAEEMEFYESSLNEQRGGNLQWTMLDDLLRNANEGFFFKGVIYGNRGAGKSTEINRLLENPELKKRFVVIRLDALDQLNPQSFSVADVLLLLMVSLIEGCAEECKSRGLPFHGEASLLSNLQGRLAPFFPELQPKTQKTDVTSGTGEVNFLQIVKFTLRVEGQVRSDKVEQREMLTELDRALDSLISELSSRLEGREILIVGEDFDKEAISRKLLEETFVQYSSLLRSLRLHFLFTLPVPFIYGYGFQLPFHPENRYPIYDVAIYDELHQENQLGIGAILDLIARRADSSTLFAPDALLYLIIASGGDLFLLFGLLVKAGAKARYRFQEFPDTLSKVTLEDAERSVLEQLSIFRNEMGTSPNSPDQRTWLEKRETLRKIYTGNPEAAVPDAALHGLLRRRAVLFCNGKGRYAVHPLAVEMLVEQFAAADPQFVYKGGGLKRS